MPSGSGPIKKTAACLKELVSASYEQSGGWNPETLRFLLGLWIAGALSSCFEGVSSKETLRSPSSGPPPSSPMAGIDALIEANLHRRITLPFLAQQAGLSVRQLSRLYRRHKGVGVHQGITRLRLESARRFLLEHPLASIKEAAYAFGFADTAHFSHRFRSHFGHAPSKTRHYRIQGAAEVVPEAQTRDKSPK